jgi:hypothetical protein
MLTNTFFQANLGKMAIKAVIEEGRAASKSGGGINLFRIDSYRSFALNTKQLIH